MLKVNILTESYVFVNFYSKISGIKYFKAGNNVEAFQCLNQALNIDADNVEGLVARGALYANNGGLEKAVDDFEKALVINRSHKNARKYLCETLIAVARNHEDGNKVDAAIETYQRILTIVPDHKEALDSIYFLRGRPKDAPLRDDQKQGENRNKPRLSLDGDKEKSEKKKKKKRRRHSSGSSSDSGSDSGDASRRNKRKKKDRKSRSDSKSPSPLNKRPVSPFSVKMAPGDSGVPAGGVMNMPEEFQKSAPSQLGMNLPLPDLRQDIERLKGHKSEEDVSQTLSKAVPPGFPMIDLTKPPPGYMPPAPGYSQRHEQEYDEKVRRFLEETAQGNSSSQKRRSGHSSRSESSRSRRRSSRRSRSSSRHRKTSRRSRTKEKRKGKGSKSRSRSKGKDKKVKEKESSKSPEKILVEDDDFTKKLNDHLFSSKKKRSRSRSKGKKSRSRSKNRKTKRKSRSRSREKKKKSKSRSKEKKRRSKSKEVLKEIVQTQIKDIETRKSVFDRLDGEPIKETSQTPKAKPSPAPGSGMWIPTGEDSIIEGVKEAINKVEKKERRRSGEDDGRRGRKSGDSSTNVEFEIKYDGRTGMYTRVQKEFSTSANDNKNDIVEIESRIVRKLPDSPAAKVPEKKRSPSPNKSRRSKSRDRRRSGRSRSRPRHKSRSRSRRRRSRSRHHRQRSRSRSRIRSRRSRSRERRGRSKSRSKSPEWKHRSDYKETQSKLLQSDITDMREETRRLQTEREAVFREKERLLSASAVTPASKAKIDTQTSSGNLSFLY